MVMSLRTSVSKMFKKSDFWSDNLTILKEFNNFRKIAVIALVFTLLGSLFEGATIGLIASFLQGLTNPEQAPIQTSIGWFDRWFLATEVSSNVRIYRLSAFILLVIWIRTGFYYLGRIYSRLAQINLVNRIRILLFEQLQSFSLTYYSKTRYGELINTVTNEVNQLQQACETISFLITRSSLLLAYVAAIFCLSWQLSIASVMLYGLLSVGLSTLIGKVREASFAVPKANGNLTSIIIEFISGIRTIKAFATEGHERERFYRANAEVMQKEMKVASVSELIYPLAEGASSSILIVMVMLAFGWSMSNGNLKAASLLTFMFALFRMMPLISQINGGRQKLNTFQGSVRNIKSILRKDDKPYLNNGSIGFVELNKSIDFASVDFGYDLNNLVLQDITLSIPKGKTTALVGASGAGKTTLADLIPRFYDATRGSLTIDSLPIQDYEISSLRRNMAVVSQDTFIFNNSIRYNIAYGLKSISDRQIEAVARQANAWEFIQESEQGLDTVLGDRGVRLSGGQRQRIAIARALLRNPQILILDEATSALDSVTEKLIQDSLEKLSRNRTVIVIAHRLSTIVNADKVVVLERGKVVEQGEYQELLNQKGELWKYHKMQYELSK